MQRRHSHNMSPADGRCMYAAPTDEVWYGAAQMSPPRCVSPQRSQAAVAEMAMAVVAAQKKVSPSSSRLGMYPPEVSSRRLEDGWAGVESEAAARRRAELSGELLGSPPSPHVSCGSHSPRAASGASLSPREISPRISCSSQSHLQSPRISCSSLSPRTHNSNASSFVYDASPDAGYSPYSPVPPWTAARANDRSSVPASSYSPYPPAPASSLTPRSAVVISYPHGPGCSPAMNAATEAWSAVASSGAQAAGAAAAAAGAALQGLGGTGDAGLAASEDEVRAALAEESLDLALTLITDPHPNPGPSPNPNPYPPQVRGALAEESRLLAEATAVLLQSMRHGGRNPATVGVLSRSIAQQATLTLSLTPSPAHTHLTHPLTLIFTLTLAPNPDPNPNPTSNPNANPNPNPNPHPTGLAASRARAGRWPQPRQGPTRGAARRGAAAAAGPTYAYQSLAGGRQSRGTA